MWAGRRLRQDYLAPNIHPQHVPSRDLPALSGMGTSVEAAVNIWCEFGMTQPSQSGLSASRQN